MSTKIAKNDKPMVYLAGKITNNWWRTEILGGGTRTNGISLGYYFLEDVSRYMDDEYDAGDCIITGPHSLGCDHSGCFHSKENAMHTAAPTHHSKSCAQDSLISRFDVKNACCHQIDKSDMVFAYIDSLDCYGTLAEIGYAYGKGKKIYILYENNMLEKELWFVSEMANVTYGQYYGIKDAFIESLKDYNGFYGQKLVTAEIDNGKVKVRDSKQIEKMFKDSDIDTKIDDKEFLEILNYHLDGLLVFRETSTYVTVLSTLSLFKSGKMLKNGTIVFFIVPSYEDIMVSFSLNNKKTSWNLFYKHRKYKARDVGGVEGLKELFYDIFDILDGVSTNKRINQGNSAMYQPPENEPCDTTKCSECMLLDVCKTKVDKSQNIKVI